MKIFILGNWKMMADDVVLVTHATKFYNTKNKLENKYKEGKRHDYIKITQNMYIISDQTIKKDNM